MDIQFLDFRNSFLEFVVFLMLNPFSPQVSYQCQITSLRCTQTARMPSYVRRCGGHSELPGSLQTWCDFQTHDLASRLLPLVAQVLKILLFQQMLSRPPYRLLPQWQKARSS